MTPEKENSRGRVQSGAPLYALVAVPVPLRRAFHYRIPERLLEKTLPGARAAVEFGASRLVGVVLGLDRAPGIEPEKLKDILEILDPRPMLTADLLGLAHWLSDYYHHPIGETIQTVLPPFARRPEGVSYIPIEGGEANALTPSARALCGKMEKKGSLPFASLGRGSGPVVEELIEKGFARPVFVSREKTAGRAVKWVMRTALAPEPESLGQNRAKLALLISLLKKGPATMAELASSRITADTVKRAVKAGYAELSDEYAPPLDVSRLGYGGEKVDKLTPDQQKALTQVNEALDKGEYKPFLVMGVTGSGKTELYMRAAARAAGSGRGVLILVPEISLTPQLIGRFALGLGHRFAVFHSSLPARERMLQYEAVKEGGVRIVVGTRSAVFAPVKNLGLIVVDEEHEPGFKQEDGLRYNAKHAALVRAREAGAAVLLGSATPDLESFNNARSGRYTLLALPERAAGAEKPVVEIIDIRQEEAMLGRRILIGSRMKNAVDKALLDGGQALFFINRRGYAPALYCPSCGESVRCRSCSVPMTLHRRGEKGMLKCHYCGSGRSEPQNCPACGALGMILLGAGTQKTEDEVQKLWPGARVARLDADSARLSDMRALLSDFAEKKIDILIGTQMVAKGHHFPGLTLVGVLNADDGLGIPDFRAAERTFQLITQVAGRAGRVAGSVGRVVIQTRNPGHPVLLAAAKGDYEEFALRELAERKAAGFPPLKRAVLVRISAGTKKAADDAAQEAARILRSIPAPPGTDFLGPAPAPLEVLKGRVRRHILIRTGRQSASAFKKYLARFVELSGRQTGDVRLALDADPVSLL